jgi:glucosamine--fructose-6-phosphate aminotransferase (isomerizing)
LVQDRASVSILYREIHEQPEVLRVLFDKEMDAVSRLAKKWRNRGIEYVTIAARGSSDNAAAYGKYVFGAMNQLAVALPAPSLLTLYGARPKLKRSLVIAISQSGASPDILSVVEEARAQNVPSLAVTNSPSSPLAGIADDVLCLHAGEEKSLAATKSFTASLAALAMISVALGDGDPSPRLDELRAMPEKMSQALARETEVGHLVPYFLDLRYCTVIGRGFNHSIAFEIALKLKELSYLGSEAYSPADFLHGPIAMVDERLYALVIAPQGKAYPNVVEFIGRMKNEGAQVVAIGDKDETIALACAGVRVPEVPEWLSPLVTVIPGQLLALALTQAKGYDVDHPRRLVKVTKTV